jgi:outer membrane receptor protein involved in Fe transport
MNRKVLIDAALFSMHWNDLQAVIGEGPGGAGEVIGNIGNARTNGIDLSVRARPVQELELMAGLTLLDAKTQTTVTLPDPAGNGNTIVVPAGSRIPRAPKNSFNLAATYRTEVFGDYTGMVRLGVNHVGDSISFLYRQDQVVAAYTTTDLKIGIEGERWSLYAYATNLTDQRVQLFREPSDDPVSGKPQYYWGRPRTVGLNLTYAFE